MVPAALHMPKTETGSWALFINAHRSKTFYNGKHYFLFLLDKSRLSLCCFSAFSSVWCLMSMTFMKCMPFAKVSWTCLECVAARKDRITLKWSPPKTSIISKLLDDQGQYSTNSVWMQWHNRAMLWNKALIVLLFVKVQWPHSLM